MEEERARRLTNGNEAEGPTAPKTTKRQRSERTVNDKEVDEFFAILKRLKEVKRLKNSSMITSGDETRQCGVSWQPVFTLDDFKEASNGRDRKHCAIGNGRDGDGNDNEVISRSFDLNVEPEVDPTNC